MSTKNPWKKISTELKYQNPWIALYEDKIVQPDGKEGIYGSVRVQKHLVRIIAEDKDGKIIMNYEYRYTADKAGYELPAGAIEKGQSELEAAKAELLQETGYTAKNWHKIGGTHTWPSVTDLHETYYFATDLVEPTQAPQREGNEGILDTKKFALEEIQQMIISGKIFCASTISGLMIYALHKK